MARLVSVNVGSVRRIEHHGRLISTAIWKEPVDGPVHIAGQSVDGDHQADPTAHGGALKAVYAYAEEDYGWWSRQLDRTLAPGVFGENLTTSGLDVSGAVLGERWSVGSAILQVTEPRVPCFKLGLRMGDPRFPQVFGRADRPGAYLRIVRAGEVRRGDAITVLDRPVDRISVAEVARIYNRQRFDAHRLLAAEHLSPDWLRWAERVMADRERGAVRPEPPRRSAPPPSEP